MVKLSYVWYQSPIKTIEDLKTIEADFPRNTNSSSIT